MVVTRVEGIKLFRILHRANLGCFAKASRDFFVTFVIETKQASIQQHSTQSAKQTNVRRSMIAGCSRTSDHHTSLHLYSAMQRFCKAPRRRRSHL